MWVFDHVYEAPFANMKMECQMWPEMPLILGRSGTQYVAMVTKLLSLNCVAHLKESYCKESNISDINWSRYLLFIIFDQIWLSVWCHHLVNLHILKTWIFLEQKERFENSKHHFLLMQATCLNFKMASINKCNFRHSGTLTSALSIAFISIISEMNIEFPAIWLVEWFFIISRSYISWFCYIS